MPFYNLPSLIQNEAESERYPLYKEALLDVLTTFSKSPEKRLLSGARKNSAAEGTFYY